IRHRALLPGDGTDDRPGTRQRRDRPAGFCGPRRSENDSDVYPKQGSPLEITGVCVEILIETWGRSSAPVNALASGLSNSSADVTSAPKGRTRTYFGVADRSAQIGRA